jgi:DNA-binding winged helix-turn-helix (wHTH) protein/TolB-like protein/Flp pilus assembly protein TadD
MLPPVSRLGVVRFGTFEADFRARELRKAGVRIKLHDQPFQVLAMLLDRPGELVNRDQIRNRLWPGDTFVDFDHGLNNAVARLREALGDSADTPRFIETLPRRGYRFITPVNWQDSGPDPVVSGSEALSEEPKSRARFSARKLKILAISGVVVLAIAIGLAVTVFRGSAPPQPNGPQPIAVLPLQNTSAAKDLDFLRIGLADDIANTLSYYPALSMRPFAITNRYAGADVDLQKAAREMRVGHIITGHFVVAGDQIEVTLEAIDVVNNRVLWQNTLRGAAHDLIGIQEQVATRLQHGLIAALGVTAGPGATSNTSHNAEAYELYLRAVSEGNSTNSQIENAIRLLQRAVALDPGYSSAWALLGHLFYYESAFYESGFGDVDKAMRLRAKAALQRAVALDSGRVDAASDLITIESEEGELNRAYDDITQLLHRRPDSGAVHLVYSYVLWYGGLLNDAANECEKARSLDAGTTDLASCGYIFMALGRYERAREYLQLYSGSEYERMGNVEILLREGRQNEALQELKTLPATVANGRQMLEPCLQHRPHTQAEAIAAHQLHLGVMAEDDPLPKYSLAGWDSLCDQPDLAFRELHRAIEQNYCAYPQMETDPLLARVRGTPEYSQIRSLGLACQRQFLEHRKKRSSE